MFGYIKTHTSELKVGEYEYYRAAYCGLCRSMGKCTGQCSRLTLSYDFAFLTLVRLALSGDTVGFSRRRCMVHPIRKRKMMDSNATLEYCSYAAALLSYHKLIDDISDERGAKRLRARMLRPSLARMRKKALKKGGLTELDACISKKLSELSELERSGTDSVDLPADLFGEMLSEIMAFGYDGDEKRIARSIGYHIGKWIYITDALDDLLEDIEKNRYNPFAKMYGRELLPSEIELVLAALKNELCDAEGAFDLIDFGDNERLLGIVRNVIYLGMPHRVESIVSKDNCRKKGQLETDERSV